MAEGFANKLGKGKIEVFSAGSHPSGTVDSKAIAVMKEVGIDISRQKSKGFENIAYPEFDYVITLGCMDVCPFFPSKEEIVWQIDDPKGRSIEEFRKARDQIRLKVKELISKIELGDI
jgi:arsenate reductase